MKKTDELFTLPTIVKGDAWYVKFYYTEPETGKKKRFRIKENLNSIADLEQREIAAVKIQERYYQKIRTGWSPFGDGDARRYTPALTTMHDAIEEVLVFKKNTIQWYAQFEYRIKYFKQWLAKNNLLFKAPSDVDGSHIFRFLNEIQNTRNLHGRTRNNFLSDIRSLFSTMIEFGMVQANPCTMVKKINARSTQHKAYSEYDLARIKAWLDKNDPYLSIFIKFIMMGMRRSEATKVRIGDIDLKRGIILVPSKNEKTNRARVKIIFKKWMPILKAMDLKQYSPNDYFFTCSEKPGPRPPATDFFTKRFRVLKKELKLDRSYTLYGFRHTTVIALIKAGADLKDIMNITGHTTLQAFQHYAQQYLDEAPKDVSNMLKFKF